MLTSNVQAVKDDSDEPAMEREDVACETSKKRKEIEIVEDGAVGFCGWMVWS